MSERSSRRFSRGIAIVLLLAAIVLLSGCAQSRSAASQGWSGVVPFNGRVFVGTQDGRIVQLDAATGSPRAAPFTSPSDRAQGFPAFYGTPTIANGILYGGSYQGIVYGMNAETLDGVRQFEVPGNALVKGIAGSVVPSGDAVVVAATEDAGAGRIYVLDAQSLVERCRYPARGEDPIGQLWTTPLVLDGVIYAGALDHRLHAVSLADCSPAWPEPADLPGAITATPVPVNGKLYVGTFDRNFYELDIATSESRQLFAAENWFWGTPAFDGQRLYVPNLDGRLYAWDVTTGSLAWTYEPEDDRTPILATPAIHDGRVIFGNDAGIVTVLRASDGQIEWDQRVTGGAVRAPLAVEGDILYVHSVEGVVRAIDVGTTQRVWERRLEDVQ